jgi:hypothetical protein
MPVAKAVDNGLLTEWQATAKERMRTQGKPKNAESIGIAGET